MAKCNLILGVVIKTLNNIEVRGFDNVSAMSNVIKILMDLEQMNPEIHLEDENNNEEKDKGAKKVEVS